jgi:tRNA 5-methylaminomethyl-2-thiouridine biosynthesis bifunctional protein
MLDWKDGQPSFNRYGEAYFSINSSQEESLYVFLADNRLAERFHALKACRMPLHWRNGLCTGLNFQCAGQQFR